MCEHFLALRKARVVFNFLAYGGNMVDMHIASVS